MAKPATASGYEKEVTENCERLLVTLTRNLGPWKKSIYLVGGLTPRYLVPSGGQVKPLPTTGNISALNIPHASMVFDHYEVKNISAELFGDKGVATEEVRHADIVSFTCLKACALDDRHEPKDAHDLVFCIENADGGIEGAAAKFQAARTGKHGQVIEEVLRILAKRFTTDAATEGYRKDGPVAVAKFEIDGDGEEIRESRIRRQRDASEVIAQFLKAIE